MDGVLGRPSVHLLVPWRRALPSTLSRAFSNQVITPDAQVAPVEMNYDNKFITQNGLYVDLMGKMTKKVVGQYIAHDPWREREREHAQQTNLLVNIDVKIS